MEVEWGRWGEWVEVRCRVGLRRLVVTIFAVPFSLCPVLQEEKHLHNMVMHSSLVTVIRQGAGMACDSHVTVM